MSDLNRSIKIYIDGTEAANGVKTVEAAIQKLEAKLGALNGTEANYATRSKQLQKEIAAKSKTLQTYKQKIEETNRVLNNLSGATYNQLMAVQSQVRKQLRDAVPGTQQYTAALEQNRRVTEALARAQSAMRVEVGSQGTTWSKAAGFVNKYMALIGGVVASITGISMTIRRSVEDYAQISEAMAGVKKYTGMTDEAVRDLNESFKTMDTRTPRERLNELAQDAGRLGIKGKQDILDFVDAANTINVALGEDLGQDAVKNIGKLAQMFGDDEKIGLRGAMLATGSAINEVAQNSSAAEAYLVDFTARVAGTGKQAGISQSQIMGFASVLDQDMQQVEMSATALQTVIMKVYQEPATFAKMAGKDVKEFTELLKTDANEAILTLLENLGSKGGLQELAPLFKDMKLDGVRASGVINTLAANVGRVREEQERATAAYKEGTSVINEFNVQNNTVQAKLEKAKKGFQEISYELGEKLSPYMTHLITTTGSLVKGMNTLIGFIIKYSGVILNLVVSIGTYTLAVKLLTLNQQKANSATLAGIIADKASVAFHQIKLSATLALSAAKFLLAGNTGMATIAMQRFNAVSKANLIGIIASVAVAAAMAIYQFTTRTKEANTEMEKFSAELIKEQRSLDSLFGALKRSGEGTEDRRKLIGEVNKTYGQYLPNLLTEKTSLDEINAAYKRINDSLTEQIAIKIRNAATSEIVSTSVEEQATSLEEMRQKLAETLGNSKLANMAIDDIRRITSEYQKAGTGWERAWGQAYHTVKKKYLGKGSLADGFGSDMESYIRNVYDMEKKLARTEAKYKPFMQKEQNTTPEVVITAPDLSKNKNNIITDPDDEKAKKELKSKLDAENILHAQHQVELKALYLSGQDDTLQTEKQFSARMEQLQFDHQQRIIKIAGEKSKEGADAQNVINDIKLQQRKAQIQQQIDNEKTTYERQQDDLKLLYASGKDENLNSEAAYNEAIQQLAIMHLERMLQIANLDADQRRAVEKQLLDFKVKCMQDEEKERKKSQDKEKQQKDAMARRDKQRLNSQVQQYRQYGQQIGETIGQMISGQENALQGFADTMIDILFDVLSQMIEAEIAKTTGVAVGAVARSTAEAMAQPDSVASFGATGIARTAILTGLIMAALATAKSALKGLIHKGGSSSSSGVEAPKTAQVQVKQWATGRYDVIGQDDRKSYNDVPYIGPAPTGIVRRTSLVSENGAELIINAEDLSRLQKHINYPVVVQAIQDSRSGRVPQRAEGNYTPIDTPNQQSPVAATDSNATATNISQLLTELKSLIATLRNLKAYVVLRDLREAEELDRKSKQPFTRSTQ